MTAFDYMYFAPNSNVFPHTHISEILEEPVPCMYLEKFVRMHTVERSITQRETTDLL